MAHSLIFAYLRSEPNWGSAPADLVSAFSFCSQMQCGFEPSVALTIETDLPGKLNDFLFARHRQAPTTKAVLQGKSSDILGLC